MSNPQRDEDGQPIPNSVPPTPFELASLAATFLAAGKTKDMAFKLARELYEHAETEAMQITPLSERITDRNIALMPDLEKELEDECRSYLQQLGIRQPEDSDFPLSIEDFHETTLPQKLKEDRLKFFQSNVQGTEYQNGFIPDLYSWLSLFKKVVKLRGWEDRGKIKSDIMKYQTRRVSKKYKPKRQRTRVEKSG